MSELENEYLKEALEWYDEDAGQVLPGSVPHERIVDAARRFASLTSPETVEKAAQVIYEFDDAVPKPPYWSDCTEDMVAWYKSAAEAVLRSVEEGET